MWAHGIKNNPQHRRLVGTSSARHPPSRCLASMSNTHRPWKNGSLGGWGSGGGLRVMGGGIFAPGPTPGAPRGGVTQDPGRV